jgi:hypothetical protein
MAFGLSYQIDFFCGWRYLFSVKYREYVKQRWGGNLFLQCLFLTGSLLSILFTSAIVVFLIRQVWVMVTSDI